MNLTRIKSAAAIGSLATALFLAPSTPAQAVASCANGTQTDIGYTILSGGYIKLGQLHKLPGSADIPGRDLDTQKRWPAVCHRG